MAMKTAQQMNDAWKASGTQAVANYDTGVTAYTGDWAGATIAQEAQMLAGVQAAVQNGTWRTRVQNVGTQGWKSATIAKKANFQTGFTAGAQNQLLAGQKIMAALANIVGGLPARGDYNTNKNRMIGVVDGLHALRGQLSAK